MAVSPGKTKLTRGKNTAELKAEKSSFIDYLL
jgi:hypothetical protein